MRSIAVLALLGLAVTQAARVLSCACGTECGRKAPEPSKPDCCGDEVQDPVPEPECCCSHATKDMDMEVELMIPPRAPAPLAFVDSTPAPSVSPPFPAPSILEHPPPRRGRPIYLAVSTFRL